MTPTSPRSTPPRPTSSRYRHPHRTPTANTLRSTPYQTGPSTRSRRRSSRSTRLLAQQVADFLLDGQARQLTEATQRFYKQQLQAFAVFLAQREITDMCDLAPSDIRAYLTALQERGLRPHSVHAAARAIRAFCNFLEDEGVLPDSPMRRVRMPRLPSAIPPAFTEADILRLLAVCDQTRDTALILVLLDSGCRASEMLALNVGDVSTRTGQVHVRQGKGRKERLVYIGARSRRELLRYLVERGEPDEDEPLWPSQTTGERLTPAGLRMLLRRLGLRAGVKYCHPHTFRRTFALWSLRSGMNIYALQQIMGHTDLQILRRYLALVDEDLQAAHQKHGAVDGTIGRR